MIFVSHYDSPLGILYLAADEEALKGVWFEGQKYFASGLKENETEEKETPVLKQTKEWLDLYPTLLYWLERECDWWEDVGITLTVRTG